MQQASVLRSNPQRLRKDWKNSERAALKPSWLKAVEKMSTMFFIINRFIYPEPDFPGQSQDLAPFPPKGMGGGLLALHRACLSALLYKSVKRYGLFDLLLQT
jgi:hypothetical protein